MQPEHRDLGLLRDMAAYARQVLRLVDGKERSDLGEPGTRLAVERALEIVSEAASNVSNAFRDEHPEIAWRQIIALRNVLAHQYGTIDLDTIWRITTVQVPELLQLLEPLIPPDEDT